MKLTVISASFNVLSTIGQEKMVAAINSVAAIPIEHEHLIIDGASTDGTVEALRELEKTIPSLKVVSEKDSGIYDALNKGLRAAKGEFFYVLGMDDVIFDAKGLAKVVESASEGGYDMAVGQIKTKRKGHVVPRKMADAYGEFHHNCYGHQGVIVKTELARSEKVGLFDATYRICGDYKQLLTCHWNGAKVFLSPVIFAEYATDGLSGVAGEVGSKETLRAKREVYGLSDNEFEVMKATGRLPLRIARHFLKSESEFSRRMGIRLLFSYIYRKNKTPKGSLYFLFGIPLFRHKRKKR